MEVNLQIILDDKGTLYVSKPDEDNEVVIEIHNYDTENYEFIALDKSLLQEVYNWIGVQLGIMAKNENAKI